MRTTLRRFFHSPRTLLLVLGASALIPLSGCGFRPLDAHDETHSTLPELARININHIPDRTGQIIRTELSHLLNPTGLNLPAAYTLSTKYTTSSVSRGTRLDDSAVRIDVTIDTFFTLTRIPKEGIPAQALLEGQCTTVARKNNTENLYSAYVSEEEALSRAAKLAAEDIARQLSVYFKYQDRYPAIKTPVTKDPEQKHQRPTRP
ncbi:MAG: hypothetical protein JXQ84_04255 [Rhodospirillaceae bacterium]|nr:hypothetical protein [Rhodospirillaceae bacterium]